MTGLYKYCCLIQNGENTTTFDHRKFVTSHPAISVTAA
jgi:hypothetical protein